jgi:transmembrane sensor
LDEILIRSLQGRASPEENEALRRWRRESPENEERYQRFSDVWRTTAGYERPLGESPPAAAEVLGRVSGRRGRRGSPGWFRRSLPQAAAVIVSLAVGYSVAQWPAEGPAGTAPHTDEMEITTGAGEKATATLSDGTGVRLGPRSTLRVTREDDESLVWLEGRAFFGVAPDPTRTFTVRTPFGEAQALGTRFEVRAEDEEFRVLVVEGSVRVSSAGAAIEMGEGLMSRSSWGGPPTTARVERVEKYLDWMGPALVFRGTRLARAVSEIEHRYGVEVALDDPAMGDFTVTATFTDQPVESVLFVLCEIVGAECVVGGAGCRIGDRTLLAPRGADPARTLRNESASRFRFCW